MKKFMSTLMLGLAVACSMMFTGCATMSKNSTAFYAGMTIHQSYTKIAETKDAKFKAEVEDLWTQIDQIKDITEVTNVYNSVTVKFDAILAEKSLTKKQQVVLKALRRVIDKTVELAVLSEDTEKKAKAVTWLKYMREGIRTVRKLEDGEDVVLPDSECDNCCIDQ